MIRYTENILCETKVIGDCIIKVMVVTVTGSTTNGKKLSEEDLDNCLEGCEEVEKLGKAKEKLLNFVESKMAVIAPNVSALLGSTIAAQLIGLAGGLEGLTKIPSCNVQVMGKNVEALSGFSSAATMKNTGLIFFCKLIQSCPPYLQRKALRVTAAKITLATRMDLTKSCPDGSQGQKWYQEIEDKIEKWQELPSQRAKKALPIPGDFKKKKRGGRRFRKAKEK